MPLDTARLDTIRDRFPVFRDVPPALLARLAREGQLLNLPAGTRVFDERSPCGAFPLVLEGSIRVAKQAANGREILLYRVTPGGSCVLSSGCLLSRTDCSATGTAETEVTLVGMPQALFDALIDASEPFRRYVFAIFSARIGELMLLVEEVAFRRLDARLAALLVARGPEIRATHQALADELGSVREIVSRLLGQFADEKLVTLGRERVQVLDAARLKRVAAGE